MKVSINTAVFLHDMEKGKSQYECLQNLDGKPIDAIQVRGEFFNKDTKDDELLQIAELAKQHDWPVYYSVPEELFQEDTFADNLEDNLKMAEKFGMKGIKYFFGNKFLAFNDEQISKLSNILNNSSVEVTLENQPNDFGKLSAVESNLKWIKDSNLKLGYTFDAGNWYWIDQDPTKAFDVLHHYITNFHLKDILDHETVMLGQGKTNWKDLLTRLDKNVPVFLEYDIPEKNLDHEIEIVNEVLKRR